MLKIISKSLDETIRIGMDLSKHLMPGDLICLTGDLGTGKTSFTKGLGKGLGITEYITSPTYTIINEYYSGRIPLYHFDVYRLGSADEMLELGCDEYFFGNGITVLEWADNVLDILPEEKLCIIMNVGNNFDERIITMKAYGDKYKTILKEMKNSESPRN